MIPWAGKVTYFKAGREEWRVRLLLVAALLLPLILVGIFNYTTSYANLTQAAMDRREATTFLAATLLKEGFNRLNEVAQLALANRVEFYHLVRQGRWTEAHLLLKNLPEDVPFADRILLADATGALVEQKEKISELSEKDPDFRRWHETLAREGKPYISNIYQTAETPPRNIVAVAVPIRPLAKNLEGILILQVRLDTLFGWAAEIDLGPSGFLYFVDRKGRVPDQKNPLRGELADFSGTPEVQKVLSGEKGVGTFQDPLKKENWLAAYQPVPGYGWGVMAGQPVKEAFALRDQFTQRLLLIHGLILLLSVGLTIFILYAIQLRKRAEEALRKAHRELEIKVRERTRELDKANEDLKHSNAELEQFAFIASHDLQAPLRNIVSFGEILETIPLTDEKSRDYLRRMQDAAMRMSGLIQSLLNLARASTETQSFEPVNLHTILEQVLSDFEQRIKEAGAQIKIQGDWPTLQADKVQIGQLFGNLVSNGLKFHKKNEAPRLRIKSSVQKEGSVEIRFEDNGIGFDEKYREKIFQPFARLHGPKEYEGSGIGLAVCQKIVQRHGGFLTAESVPGQGTTFRVRLPLARLELSPAPA